MGFGKKALQKSIAGISFFACVILILFWAVAARRPATRQEKLSKEIGIDVSGGTEISSYDTHGGNGDGASCVALSFSGDEVLRQIEADQRWKKLPADRTVEALIYGISDETSIIGPFLSNQNGKKLIPRIQNGYYLFIDRHRDAEKNQDVLERKSYNFTAAFYDADDRILYFGKLDT